MEDEDVCPHYGSSRTGEGNGRPEQQHTEQAAWCTVGSGECV